MIESIVYGLNLLSDKSVSDNLPVEFIDALLTRAENETPVPFDDSFDSLGYFTDLSEANIKEVEIYGIYEDFCVASGVVTALEYGINARVPKGLTAPFGINHPSLRNIVATNFNGFVFGYNEDEQYHYFIAPPRKNEKW